MIGQTGNGNQKSSDLLLNHFYTGNYRVYKLNHYNYNCCFYGNYPVRYQYEDMSTVKHVDEIELFYKPEAAAVYFSALYLSCEL